jgi:hypothetical protein
MQVCRERFLIFFSFRSVYLLLVKFPGWEGVIYNIGRNFDLFVDPAGRQKIARAAGFLSKYDLIATKEN